MVARSKKFPSYKFHPFAEPFPLLDSEDLDALVKDIKNKGLEHPILLFQGEILDGRNRYRACKLAGVMPKFETFEGTKEEAFTKVISLNIQRRHLSKTQRAVVAVMLLPHQRDLAQKRRKAGPRKDRQKFADVGKATDVTGKICNVSGEYVRKTSKIKELFPDIFDAMKIGLFRSIQEAYKLVAAEQEVRRKAISILKKDKTKKLRNVLEELDAQKYIPAGKKPASKRKTTCLSIPVGKLSYPRLRDAVQELLETAHEVSPQNELELARFYDFVKVQAHLQHCSIPGAYQSC